MPVKNTIEQGLRISKSPPFGEMTDMLGVRDFSNNPPLCFHTPELRGGIYLQIRSIECLGEDEVEVGGFVLNHEDALVRLRIHLPTGNGEVTGVFRP
jgi:hypothetical protein